MNLVFYGSYLASIIKLFDVVTILIALHSFEIVAI